jgi:hypothetical protein
MPQKKEKTRAFPNRLPNKRFNQPEIQSKKKRTKTISKATINTENKRFKQQ